MIEALVLFLALLIAHALCDYPLQGDFIGRFKSWRVESPIGETIWWHLLSAHALIHAGAVWIVTGSVVIGFLEFAAHWVIDHLKCSGYTSFQEDQALHVICKVLWVLMATIPEY